MSSAKMSKEKKHSSAGRSSQRASRSGQAPLRTKKQLDEITLENKILTEKVDVLTKENEAMKVKLETIMNNIVEFSDKEEYEITDETYTLDIETNDILDMISKIVSGQHGTATVEARIEDLETRVTHLNFQIAGLTQYVFSLEDGHRHLKQCRDMSGVCNVLDVMEDKMVAFQESDAGLAMTTSTKPPKPKRQYSRTHSSMVGKKEQSIKAKIEEDSISDVSDGSASIPSLPDSETKKRNSLIQKKIQLLHQNAKELGATLNKMMPTQKLPPNTHVSKMNPFLKQYLSNELSLEKASGADWRMLARKIGLPEEQIEEVKKRQLEAPLFEVFKIWENSVGATVQILHRHLISPQMRCSIPAKRIRDFYDVD